MNLPLRILHLEDSDLDAELVKARLEEDGVDCTIDRVDTGEAFADRLEKHACNIVLVDYTLPSFDGLSALALVRARRPEVPVIFVSGTIGEDRAVETFKNGATDYVLKSGLSRLAPSIRRALKEAEEHRERQLAEAALRESEERYRSLFDSSPVGIVVSRFSDGTFYEVNDAFLNVYGYTREEVIGRTSLELGMWADPGERAAMLRLLKEQGHVRNFEAGFRKKSGGTGDLLISAERIELAGEERLLGMFTDITARKQAEAVRESTLQLLRLCNEAGDLRSLIRDLTSFFQRLTGCSAVGVRLREGDDFPYFETRGFSEEFVEAERTLCAYDQAGELIRDSAGHPALACMCGNILCGRFDPAKPFFSPRGSFWSSCTTELLATTTDAERQAKTRNRCNGEGYESVALVPLRTQGETFGLFQFNDKLRGRFTAETIATLEDLVSYVAIALAKMKTDEALREAGRFNQQIVAGAGEGIIVYGRDLRYQAWNPFMEHLSGFPAAEVLGRPPLEVFPFLRDVGVMDLLERSLAGETTDAIDFLYRAERTGRSYWVSHTATPLKNVQGGIIGVVATVQDITARKTAEEKLTSSAQMWNNTFDAMNDAIAIMDLEGNILRSNKAMIHLVDRYPQEIIDQPCWRVVHDSQERIAGCPFLRMKSSKSRETLTEERQGRWYQITVEPIIDQKGALVGGVHIMTDITDQKTVDDRLRESESKFRSLAEQNLVGTYIVQGGMFRYLNPRLADMFEYPLDEVVGRLGPLDLVVPEDRHIIERAAERRPSEEASFSHYEARGLKKSGEIIHIEIFGSRSLYLGRPAIIGIVLDITEKKKLESQLRQAQKMEAVGQLTSGIAHDFNNMLSAIIGYASLTQMKMDAADPLRYNLDQILAGTERAATLTRSLLTFSRKQIPSMALVDVNGIMRRVEMLLKRIIGEDIDLRTVLAPGSLTVEADAGQIEQVLMNLATNARDAMQNGGILTIETSVVDAEPARSAGFGKTGRCALIAVTDTGIGMDERTREKIFEPFFTTKELGRGTGLGLSMVYGIIKQHNGNIHCYSEPRMGTTFKIYLPLADAPAAVRTDGMEPRPAQERLTGDETILIAEDDEDLRNLAKSTLEEFGYTIIAATDGKDAVERFLGNRDKIGLVVTDVIMPRMSGVEVRDAIRRRVPQARVLLMSGYAGDVLQQKQLLEEGEQIILKPFAPVVLLRKVREALDRR